MQTPELKQIYKWAWIVLIVLAVFLGIKALGELRGLRDVSPAYNSITVQGEGEIFAVPDVGNFSFSVSADAETVAKAQESVTEKMDAILSALKDLGIEEKDIKTTDYSVWPKYVYREIYCITVPCPPGKQEQDGFTASHTVTVKIRETDDAGKALSVAGDKGATNLSNLSFTIDDPDKLKQDARALAIEDARKKAKSLSKELGVRLVRVVSFSDSQDFKYYGEAGMGGDMMMSARVSNAPTLPVGENKIKSNVSVTYEIR